MTIGNIIVCILAGVGAGLGTGFAGMSAAVVIAPMLITFLGVGPYEAIGIALASDVLASAFSAITYARNKNIDIKRSIPLISSVLICTVFGAWVSQQIPSATMGSVTLIMSLLLGASLFYKSFKGDKALFVLELKGIMKIIAPILCGVYIGFMCGFVGAGGGIMMLILLTKVLNYELKTAVGTSVFIMSFVALIGAMSHFVLDNTMPDLTVLAICAVSTLIFALIGSHIANKAHSHILHRASGLVLIILGIVMMIVKFS